MSITSKYRAWCFTLNNYTLLDEQHIQQTIKSLARYVIYGREIAPGTGTPHLQGYVYFHNQRQRKSVSRLLPRARLEVANGTAQQSRVYCTKDGDYWEHGEIPMEASVARAKGGAGNAARFSTAIELAEKGDIEAIKRDDPQLYLIHGPRLESLYAPQAWANGWRVVARVVGRSYRGWEITFALGTVSQSLPQETQQVVGRV